MEFKLMTKYVVVTTVSTFRDRYVMALEDLQKENPDVPVDPKWALDAVICNELDPFSSEHIGELIVDHEVVSEEEILELFDRDNKYLSEWTKEQKIAYARKAKTSC
jgi:hypothetical protein